MLRSTLFLALLMGASAVHAETNVCTTIAALPYVVTAPGQYCLSDNLTIANAPSPGQWAIQIQADDVVLDCNHHSITGPAPIMGGTLNTNGIRLEGSARTTIRNCRINGFDRAIRVGININTLPRPTDMVIEDNRISGTVTGLGGTASGAVRVNRNTFVNSLGLGAQVSVRDGVAEVRDNYVSNIGSATDPYYWGTGLWFTTSGTNSYIFASGNTVAEVVSAPGPDEASAVVIDPGAMVIFEDNIVSAPSNPANQNQVSHGVGGPGAADVVCRDNVIVGYGIYSSSQFCPAGTNRIY